MKPIKTLFFLFFYTITLFGQKPELIIPSGQNSRILAAKITPNGKYFLSAADDRSIKIYDLKEKKEVYTFWEHENFVDDIAIAPNNRTVVSAADGGEVIIWDLNTAKVLHRIKKISSPVNSSIAIHPNGKTFLVANDGYVCEYDLLSGKLLTEEEQYHDIPINKMGYIKKGAEFYLSARDNSKLDTLWNFTQNKTVEKEIIKSSYWTTALYQSCTFSEDGLTRYDVVKNPEELRISHLDEKTIKIPIVNYVPFEVEVLSKNNLLIACRKGDKISFLIFNLIKLQIDKVIDTESFYGEAFVEEFEGSFKMQIIPNQKNEFIYFTGLYNSKVYHVNIETGIVNLLITNKSQGYSLHSTKDDLFLIGYESNITKWNLSENIISNVHSSKTGSYIIPLKETNQIVQNNKIFVWDKDFIKIQDSIILDERLFGHAFSSDEKYAYLSFNSGGTILNYSSKQVKIMDFNPIKHYGIDWFNQNTLVILSESDNKNGLFFIKLEETEKIEKVVPILFNKEVKLDFISNLIVNRLNNTFVLAYEFDGSLSQIDQNGKIFNKKIFGNGLCHKLEYEPELQQIIASFDDGTILFINPETFEVSKKLIGHKTKVDHITFSEDLKKVFSYSFDNTIKIWDYEKGTLLSTISILDNNEWVVINEDGLFDASPQAMKDIYYVVNDSSDEDEPWKIIELSQLKHRYYQPNLLQIQLGYNKEPLRTPITINEIPLAPKVTTNIEDNKLKISIKNQKGGIGKVTFFIENAEVIADIRPKGKADQNAKELSIVIDLDNYKNRFSSLKEVNLKVIAWNKEEWISSKPQTIYYTLLQTKGEIASSTASKKLGEIPRIFGLVIGTSDYTGQQIDLNYAAKDAIDFANALKISSENLFNKENSFIKLLCSDTTDETQKPTRKNILKELNELENKMKPSDVLVVYLSGHGVNFGGADGDFYYLTQEASGADAAYLNDEGIRNSVTISSTELTQLLNKTTAKKKILILDACASGKAAEKMNTSKDVPASQIRALDQLQDRTGFYILAGSAADAVSYESSVYGQGLLTYSLLKAIKGTSLKQDDLEEYIDVQKLFQFAVEEVPILSKNIGGIQKPFFKGPDNQQSFAIGKVDWNTKKSIIISEPKPVFIEAIFSDSESLYDELSLSESFNANLQENAAKGKNADIAFMRVKEYPGSYRISGNYISNDESISLKYRIISDKKTVGNIYSIEIPKSEDIDKAIKKIINTIRENLI